MGTIRTLSGHQFSLPNLDPSAIDVYDIAHSLSFNCRFGGHLPRFYSVAQHCVEMSYEVPSEHALWALLHDATEAYICDMPKPFKNMLPDYQQLEKELEAKLMPVFGLVPTMPSAVQEADMRMLNTERRDIKKSILDEPPMAEPYPFRIRPWRSAKAKRLFLLRYEELTGKKQFGWVTRVVAKTEKTLYRFRRWLDRVGCPI